MVQQKQKYCLISVVMPVHNSEKYVSEAILSILNQTFFDFEFIIIDDDSTDRTWEIIQTFSDNRIVAMRNERNIGNYPSRNRGIQKARGTYIAVMDGDDIALSERLCKQYLYMEKYSEILAIGTQFDFIGLDSKIEKPTSHENICAALLNDSCFLHPSLFIRSNVMKQLGGYNEEYVYASDYDLVCRLSLLGKIENLPGTYMLYRWHPGQISQKEKLRQKKFADSIRQKYQIAFINKNKPEGLPEVDTAETGHPDIGRIIGLYIMGISNNLFQDKADKLLNFVFDKANIFTPLSVKKGLLGIGFGIMYLLRNNFVEGDEDDVLEDIDNLVFNSLSHFENNQNLNWKEIFLYLNRRVSMPDRKNLSIQRKFEKSILRIMEFS